ncbi:MAG: hypothetical protein AAF721_30825 [Myxococcota bacterium]
MDACALADSLLPSKSNWAEERVELFATLSLEGAVPPCGDANAEPEPKEWKGEPALCLLALQAEACQDSTAALQWLETRARAFPESDGAWLALAGARFRALDPDPDSGLPFNEDLPPAARLALADQVLELLAHAGDPGNRGVLLLRSAAYEQRQHSRLALASPETPEERREVLLYRADAMMAWMWLDKVCALEGLPRCASPNTHRCCPLPPLTQAEVDADPQLEAELARESAR